MIGYYFRTVSTLVVVFTEKEDNDTIRIISLRKALKKEREIYEKEI